MMSLAEITFSFRNLLDDHLIIVAVGYVVVFISLSILWGIFYNVPNVLHLFSTQKKKLLALRSEKEVKLNDKNDDEFVTGEEAAAISLAISLYINELHDVENRVLTITKISRRYSPWNSKIYSVTSGLNKRF
jgi:glutaconyl-CoA/methylmalonyl-CoA decarboxylase subunit delta